jgi:3-hydroxyacyl-[acyl-carrier-protein] dehydratase
MSLQLVELTHWPGWEPIKPYFSLTKKQIKKMLPHRGMAFMNLEHAIFDYTAPDQIVVIKRLTEKDFEFHGHIPGKPMYPGHWMLELCNLAAILLIKIRDIRTNGSPAIAAYDKIRFKRKVLPGETMKVQITLEKNRDNKIFQFSALIRNQNDKEVALIEKMIGTAVN